MAVDEFGNPIEETQPTAPAPSNPDIDTSYVPEVNVPNIGKPEVEEGYKAAAQSVLDKPTESQATYEAPTVGQEPDRADYVDPNSMVANQLSSLLSSDSKYMKAINQGSREEAAALGLTDTSMAVGAGQLAAIKGGLPIAQADAGTYAKAQQLQQGAANQAYATQTEGQVSGALQAQKYSLLNESQALQASFDILAAGADAEANVLMQDTAKKWDFAIQDSIKRLEFNLSSALQNKEYEQKQIENVRAQAASMLENNQISIENMLKDPDILELGPEAVATNIDNMIALTTSGIQFLYDAAGLDMDNYIGDLLADYESIVSFAPEATV